MDIQPTASTGVAGAGFHGQLSEGTATPADFLRSITTDVDLSQKGALEIAKEVLAPLFTAAKGGLASNPEKSMVLAQATHDAYFTENDKPLIEKESSFFVDPRVLTKSNADQLKVLLTEAGQKKVNDYIGGQSVGNGKIFITPSEILSGKAQEFLAFFGKPNGDATGLEALISAKDTKKKIFNNQAMEWVELMNRFGVLEEYRTAMADAGQTINSSTLKSETVYSGLLSQEILKVQSGHQFDAVADSSIALAALETGVIKEENLGPAYYVLWATHNDWQPKAKLQYSSISEVEKRKDFSIFEAHRGINGTNNNVFAPSVQAVRQLLLTK